MKSKVPSCLLLATSAAVWLAVTPAASLGQTLYVSDNTEHTVDEFNATTGAATGSLFSGGGAPTGLALSGNDLYVGDPSNNTVREFNVTTDAQITAFAPTSTGPAGYPTAAATGMDAPEGLALSGGYLYVSNYYSERIGIFDATTGATVGVIYVGYQALTGLAISGNNLYVVNAVPDTVEEFNLTTNNLVATFPFSVPTGGGIPAGVAISGNNLYVAIGDAVDELNATTGSPVAQFAGVSDEVGIAVSGNDLYVSGGTIGVLDATTGVPVAGITPPVDSGNPAGYMVISPAPEPSTWVQACVGLALLGGFHRFRRAPNWRGTWSDNIF